jgi:hypothetical protein
MSSLLRRTLSTRQAAAAVRPARGCTLVADDVEGLMTYQWALNDPNPVPELTLRAWAEGMLELYP